MKKWWIGFLVLFCVGMSSGFSEASVKEDLVEYQKMVGAVTGKLEKDMKFLEGKMRDAKTSEEVEAVLVEILDIIKIAQKDIAKFSPQSDKVKVINMKIQMGMTGTIDEFGKMLVAFRNQDQVKFNEAVKRGTEHANAITAAENEMAKLAAEENVEWRLEI